MLRVRLFSSHHATSFLYADATSNKFNDCGVVSKFQDCIVLIRGDAFVCEQCVQQHYSMVCQQYTNRLQTTAESGQISPVHHLNNPPISAGHLSAEGPQKCPEHHQRSHTPPGLWDLGVRVLPLCVAAGDLEAGIVLVELFRQGHGGVGDLCGDALILCDVLQTQSHPPGISSRLEAVQFLPVLLFILFDGFPQSVLFCITYIAFPDQNSRDRACSM